MAFLYKAFYFFKRNIICSVIFSTNLECLSQHPVKHFRIPQPFSQMINDLGFSLDSIISWRNTFDPLGQPTVTGCRDNCFRTCCPSHFSKSSKTKPISSENNVHYWRDCGSGLVDHFLQEYFFPPFLATIFPKLGLFTCLPFFSLPAAFNLTFIFQLLFLLQS